MLLILLTFDKILRESLQLQRDSQQKDERSRRCAQLDCPKGSAVHARAAYDVVRVYTRLLHVCD